MRVGRAAAVLAVAVLLVALLPTDGWAWSPGTHIFLGQAVLTHLDLLPSAIASVLQACPLDFLYGSIAADTSFAKKYVPAGRHSHSWHVGEEIVELAATERLTAFGLGYLAHLAADTIAHNYFVPRQLVLTSTTRALGHSYWEARFDHHIGEQCARKAREVIALDHGESDAHLDRIISPTIFSVRTNRRLFRGMVQLTDLTNWQRVVQLAAENSRWDLGDPDVERHMATAYDLVLDCLIAGGAAHARRLDPSGHTALAAAKRMRRHALLTGGRRDEERIRETAEEHFGVKASGLGYWEKLDVPRPWETNGRRR
ncbi:MAG: zinc dependent phospholipase C family protein [Gemmatimonadota bacterium]